jgi:Carboxypeptidase regulatory-like domain
MRLLASFISGASLLVCLYVPIRLPAQAVYGSIVGVVTDSTGGAVTPAKVLVRDVDRDVTFTAVTNQDGNYSFSHLIAGR